MVAMAGMLVVVQEAMVMVQAEVAAQAVFPPAEMEAIFLYHQTSEPGRTGVYRCYGGYGGDGPNSDPLAGMAEMEQIYHHQI